MRNQWPNQSPEPTAVTPFNPLSRAAILVRRWLSFFVRLRERMTMLWIFMSVGALIIGLLVSWRIVRCWRGHLALIYGFLAVMVFSLGFWILRFGCSMVRLPLDAL